MTDTIEARIIQILKDNNNQWVKFNELVSYFDSMMLDKVYYALNSLIKETIIEVAIDYHRDPMRRIHSNSFTLYRYIPPAPPTLTVVK